MMVSTSPEKPWYTPMIVAFLSNDVPRLLGISSVVFTRDVNTLEKRLAAEGESFLTKTLPKLGLAIDQALQGHMPLVTPHFKKCGRTALPAFLQALLRRVFKEDGWVAVNPCIKSIRLLRQICFWCKKIEKGFTDESLQKAIVDFMSIDAALPAIDEDISSRWSHLGTARAIVELVFQKIHPLELHTPRHGPGAVASSGNTVEKRRLNISYADLERVFRPIPWFRSLRDAAANYECVTGRTQLQHGTSRTEFVEKDSSGPRTIGLEPAEYMWCQQAIKDWLYTHIENRSVARGQVNFTDQTINRELAKKWEDYVTLDMSKASDRNSFALVKLLFENTKVWPYLQASRTPATVLPGGHTLQFRKFAPMGSAVCFPVQACVYYALACAVLHKAGVPLLQTFNQVFVYGDDLIVPHGYFHELTMAFEAVGLKFNADKCCTRGMFRESCGLDAFNGIEVTPIRLRRPYRKSGTPVIPSIIAHANELMNAGYWSAAESFREAALVSVPDLKSLGIPFSGRDFSSLPILHWQDPFLPETVAYRTKNGITTARGWVFSPHTMRSIPALEMLHFRESLCSGGPVGRQSYRHDHREVEGVVWRYQRPGTGVRLLDKRYSGTLRLRNVPVIRE